ncbi:hypothetical protein [Rathayibacter toxicus]|uniref:Asl1-like glycosyl hydrolase catalytic domain-containing protein n=1 Tax=Rathayibacter toxicus TaxID=145458 RepID=A0A0C5B8H9_9MICO|nr:hypothetical protein [Rathayibacter toxicus]AJM77068.1 hypothetical protein TI83_01960 [Rathayibacter toxicus]ALS57119.1 hypothetical protein APU90_04525 [Rathayibacter toxicus]KKM46069.1 hypothetical protein VT73_02970 [Rathayibacter toxicus]PPG23003.1 hypothetical protein C5D15_01740 [Rathayibacter toxicus]PPG47585.1 hypothetical protein C5D16_01735 [Rathayibacter toxicus]
MRLRTSLYRAVVIVVAAALVITVQASPAAALDPPVIGEPYGSLVFQTGSPSIPVYNSNGLGWTVVNSISGAQVGHGQVTGDMVTPNGLPPGLFTLTVSNSRGTTTAVFLVVGETPSPDPYFGVQTHFAFPDPTTWSAPEKTLPALQEIGFSSIRDESYWQYTEKTPGERKIIDGVARYQRTATSLNLNRLFTADFGNTAVQDSLGVCDSQDPVPCQRVPETPAEQHQFARYAIAVLDQTAVQRVELWNEFNHPAFNYRCKTGACYARIFGPIADEIKKAHPEVQIIGGGLSGADMAWFEDFYAAGGLKHAFDAVSYHPYSDPQNKDLDTYGGYLERAKNVRDAQKRYLPSGAAPVPILLTEVGWTTVPQSVPGNPARALDDTVQGERLASTYIIHAHAGAETVYWYEGVDLGFDPDCPELNFGVFRTTTATVRSFQPKKAALALRVLRDQVDGYTQTGLEKLDSGVWRATYTNGPLTKLALFADSVLSAEASSSSNPTTVAADSVIPAGETVGSAVDAFGSPVDLSGSSITLSSRPVYVTLSNSAISF